MNEFIQPISGKTLNLSTHYSLFKENDVYYLFNGDVQGNEGSNKQWFVQNALGNGLCVDFPEGYTLNGPGIKLNNFEYVLFFVIGNDENSEIGILDTENCIYTPWAQDPCLGFRLGHPIRGLYKFNNGDNDRRIYFIDGINPNRYADIDKPHPVVYTGSKCNSCNQVEGEDLDCEQLQINKMFAVPCAELTQTDQGQFLPGVYQIGLAYSQDRNILTDFYFSQPFRAFSEVSNIGFKIDIDCVDTPFDEMAVVLVSTTRENSLVVYNFGFYPSSSRTITLANTSNATVLDTSIALQKSICYDYSEHIATNDETLLLGKHKIDPLLNYQPLANEISVKWQEVKVPKNKAHMYPSFLRDEVYALAIEWISRKGKSKGLFHIPGRSSEEFDIESPPTANDIYEMIDCDLASGLLAWQIENTASATDVYNVDCEDCSGLEVSKEGYMSYWESENLTYPNDPDIWGDLACQKIRHHKMPSHNVSHIHDDFTPEQVASALPCVEEEVYAFDLDGDPVNWTINYCPPDIQYITEEQCVNVLGIKLYNIQHPEIDTLPDPDIMGYRIWVADRKGNKSILHKGLIYNMAMDTSTEDLEIFYPNYPFNDLNPDVYLTSEQIDSDTADVQTEDPLIAGHFVHNRFTYHSPDIHYRETTQEFGTEMKVYGEEIGWIEGKFKEVYTHPQTRLGFGGIQSSKYVNHATQVNSVCHYSGFTPWTQSYLSRFKIEASQYLLPINQLTSDNKKINNYLRESSYYVAVNRDVDTPTNPDVSRILASEIDMWDGRKVRPSFNYFDEVNRSGGNKNIQGVSYYVGVKIKQPDQYGPLDTINYSPVTCIIETSPSALTYESETIYGGDVFISKHSLVRKFPIFTQYLQDVPVTTETNQREYRNLWYPRFWYDNLTQADDQYNLDGFRDLAAGGDIYALGVFYIWVNGIIDYWCESEFIGNFRERDFTPNGTFYPKAEYNDLLRDDKLPLDNKYLYNFALLTDNVEVNKQSLNRTESDADFTVIYSKKNDFQAGGDPWLQFLPLNYTILPRTFGKFTAMHPTDMYSILFGFEDAILYSQANFTVNINEGQTLLLGQGDIFANRLQKLSNEQTGYVGTVDPWSFVNTRYGTFFLDRKRKKLFNWSGNLKDVTGDMFPWFNKYMTGAEDSYDLSTVCVFDNFTKNLYITDKHSRDRWTISYKPDLQGFISFHSFTPDYYLTLPNNFISYQSDKSLGVWKHNSLYNYQTYYGEQVPFDLGLVVNNQFKTTEYQSLEIFSEWIRIDDFGQEVYVNNFFDQIFAYTAKGTTGLQSVLLKNKENPVQSIAQNQPQNLIEVTKVEDSIYRLNKLESILNNPNSAVIQWDSTGMTYNAVNTNPVLNPLKREDLKGKWMKIHFISNSNTQYKILIQLLVPNVDKINV